MRYVALAVCALLARAQSQPPHVILNVTALDAKSHPVTDLTDADIQIFDEGKLLRIASFKLTAAAPTTLVLFDLLNAVPLHREYTASLIVKALEPLETGDSVYLYLLTNHAEVYPVHALPPQAGNAQDDGRPAVTPWTRQVHPLLDQAIQNVYGLRHMDDKDRGIRSEATFYALGKLGEQFTELPGPKTIIWITSGVANWLDYPYGCREARFEEGLGTYLAGTCNTDCTAQFKSRQCIDYTPFLRHFCALLDRHNTILSSVEDTPAGSLPPADRGTPKDTLQQLSNLTGGRMYDGGEVVKAIAQSLEDARARYQLAYDAPSPDGRYHKLRVACGRKGIRIESPRVYFADQP
jgi:VWFA-related protein